MSKSLYLAIFSLTFIWVNEAISQPLQSIMSNTVKIFLFDGKTTLVSSGFYYPQKNLIVTTKQSLLDFFNPKFSKLRLYVQDLSGAYLKVSIDNKSCPPDSEVDICAVKLEYEKVLHNSNFSQYQFNEAVFLAGHCKANWSLRSGTVLSVKPKEFIANELLSIPYFASPNGMFMTTIPTCPGDSGAAVFNQRGEIIGMNSFRAYDFLQVRSFVYSSQTIERIISSYGL